MIRGVAVETKGRGGIVLNEELAVLVVVRVVAGGALHLLVVIQVDLAPQSRRISEFAFSGGQGGVIAEGNGMMRREVGAEAAAAHRQSSRSGAHGDGSRAISDHAEGNGTIVAAQAEPGSAGWLADSRFEARAGIRLIDGGRHLAIPQRDLCGRGVRRVTEDADVGLCAGTKLAGAAGGEVVFGIDDALGIGKGGEGGCP